MMYMVVLYQQTIPPANTLNIGEGLRFDVDNAVSPETDDYTIVIGYIFS